MVGVGRRVASEGTLGSQTPGEDIWSVRLDRNSWLDWCPMSIILYHTAIKCPSYNEDIDHVKK